MKERKRFQPEQRLRKQDSFKTLVETGSFVRGRFFYIWVAERPEHEEKQSAAKASLGVVVNRKTQPKATDRNLLKRRVREIFREAQGDLRPGAAILLKAKEGCGMPGFEDMKKDILGLLIKSGAVK